MSRTQKTETTFYELLGINRNATVVEIRKAYRRTAIRVHPDKNLGRPEAHAEFQRLSRAAEVLTDPRLRAKYDRGGEAALSGDEEGDLGSFESAMRFYRSVTPDDVEKELGTYRGSKEETNELLKLATQFNGNLTRVLAFLPGSTESDLPRFRAILRAARPNLALSTPEPDQDALEEDIVEEDRVEESDGDDSRDAADTREKDKTTNCETTNRPIKRRRLIRHWDEPEEQGEGEHQERTTSSPEPSPKESPIFLIETRWCGLPERETIWDLSLPLPGLPHDRQNDSPISRAESKTQKCHGGKLVLETQKDRNNDGSSFEKQLAIDWAPKHTWLFRSPRNPREKLVQKLFETANRTAFHAKKPKTIQEKLAIFDDDGPDIAQDEWDAIQDRLNQNAIAARRKRARDCARGGRGE